MSDSATAPRDFPVQFIWQGDAFTPASSFWARKADAQYVIGERYELVEHKGRSSNSHRHYFASVHESWSNLPEQYAEQFPTSESLRKWALIKEGFHDSHSMTCSSRTEALKLAAYIRPIDEFAVVTVSGATVTRYTAKSQSMKAMGKDEFQRSKTAVLDLLSSMIGAPAKVIADNTGRSA